VHLQTHHPLKIKTNGEHKNPTSSKTEDETKISVKITLKPNRPNQMMG
jgi:hypothetical protein